MRSQGCSEVVLNIGGCNSGQRFCINLPQLCFDGVRFGTVRIGCGTVQAILAFGSGSSSGKGVFLCFSTD